MKKTRLKIETWQLLFVVAASGVAVVFLNSLAYGFSPQTVADSLIYTFFIASSVMLGILYLAPKIFRLSATKRIVLVSAAIFVTTLFGIILARSFLNALGLERNILPGARTTVFSLVISYTFGFSAYFYLHSQTILRRTKELLRQKELDEARAQTLAAEARLAALESRLQPHFLFNTLNSIAALIKDDPEKAEKMIEKLSALLRYSLDGQTKGVVSLSDELEITQKYLEIEKVRFGNRLEFKFETNGNFEEIKIPALALQTLVENSIKHVASKRSETTEIFVSASRHGDCFILEVSDNGGGFSEKELKPEHGLDNLRKRLDSIFQDEANLEIVNNGFGKVCLKIPLLNENRPRAGSIF